MASDAAEISPAGDRPPPVAFSHVGIHAFDHERLARFYRERLGLVETDRGSLPGRGDLIFLSRDPREHHQLVLISGRTAGRDTRHVNQISFRVRSLDELKQLHARLKDDPEASDLKPTNHGAAWALYCLDPEGNRIELFVDTPWYIPQPLSEPFDLEAPVAEIEAATEARCRSTPGFRPMAEFQAEIARRIAHG
ncbi:MAG: VOC family protein [Azospirillaceae bacterium]